MAVAPVQHVRATEMSRKRRSAGDGSDELIGVRSTSRWRLIMQYYDHTILSYELSRDGSSDELCVPSVECTPLWVS